MYIFMAHIIVREVAAQVAGKALSISLSLLSLLMGSQLRKFLWDS